MKLKSLTIKNFRGYYGEKKFDFSEGLTLIIADNGNGKTTFFEALSWVLGLGEYEEPKSFISEMLKVKMTDGSEEEVSVSIKILSHEVELELIKSIKFVKNNNNIQIVDESFDVYSDNGVERKFRDNQGESTLNRVFDIGIRRYSLFKGETSLDIFKNNDESLSRLLRMCSEIKNIRNCNELVLELSKLAEERYEKVQKKSSKNEKLIYELNEAKNRIESEIMVKKDLHQKKSAEEKKLDNEILNMVDLSREKEQVIRIDEQIKNLDWEKEQIGGKISINYNYKLLDDLWILCGFSKILSSFAQKASDLNEQKQAIIENAALEKGRQEGFINSILPLYFPDMETLERIIKSGRCALCGSKAEKGSEAYEQLLLRLKKLKKLKKEGEAKDGKGIVSSVIDDIYKLSLKHSSDYENEILNKIEETMEDVKDNRRKLKSLNNKKALLENEKSQLLAKTGRREDELKANDYRSLKELLEKTKLQIHSYEEDLKNLEDELIEKKQKIEELVENTPEVDRARRIKDEFNDILSAFSEAENHNRDNFLKQLEKKANNVLKKISGDNDLERIGDFHGVIRIKYNEKLKRVEIGRYNEDTGRLAENLSQSQETCVNMAILFAVAEIASEARDDEYPLVFDAPTSSFGESKEANFYEVINSIERQCIILTKDMISSNGEIKDEARELNCSIYCLAKDDGFNPNDQSTINIKIQKIK